MAGFDENIVREYFELNGFLVRQLRKYQVHSRSKRADEQLDLVVVNPAVKKNSKPKGFQLFSSDLACVHRAVVVVKGWHTSSFTPRMMQSGKSLFDFLQKDVIALIERYLGIEEKETGMEEKGGQLLKLLVLPGLPVSDPHRQESIALLREKGIDGIISFRTILESVIRQVEPNYNYHKSEFLHILRLLKIYDMIRPPQMELFQDDT